MSFLKKITECARKTGYSGCFVKILRGWTGYFGSRKQEGQAHHGQRPDSKTKRKNKSGRHQVY